MTNDEIIKALNRFKSVIRINYEIPPYVEEEFIKLDEAIQSLQSQKTVIEQFCREERIRYETALKLLKLLESDNDWCEWSEVGNNCEIARTACQTKYIDNFTWCEYCPSCGRKIIRK